MSVHGPFFKVICVNGSAGRGNLAVVDTVKRAIGDATVDDDIDARVFGHRIGIILEEMGELAIDHQILVAVIFGDGKTELAVRARRESPR